MVVPEFIKGVKELVCLTAYKDAGWEVKERREPFYCMGRNKAGKLVLAYGKGQMYVTMDKVFKVKEVVTAKEKEDEKAGDFDWELEVSGLVIWTTDKLVEKYKTKLEQEVVRRGSKSGKQ